MSEGTFCPVCGGSLPCTKCNPLLHLDVSTGTIVNVDELQAENAKLRELVRLYHAYVFGEDEPTAYTRIVGLRRELKLAED